MDAIRRLMPIIVYMAIQLFVSYGLYNNYLHHAEKTNDLLAQRMIENSVPISQIQAEISTWNANKLQVALYVLASSLTQSAMIAMLAVPYLFRKAD